MPFDIFIYDLVEGSMNTVIKCADATKFRSIAHTKGNREMRPMGGQKENYFPLGRST